MSSVFSIVAPADLGLPPKFQSFRQAQRETLDWLSDECNEPLSAACLPTGAGKTVIAISLGRMLGGKTVYVVATKALQAQVLKDFAPMGMVDIRGAANYHCPQYGNCDVGGEHSCSLSRTVRCPRKAAFEAALAADLVVTNYAYWLNATTFRDEADVSLLICDEFHAVEGQLTSCVEVELTHRDLKTLGSKVTYPVNVESGLIIDFLVWVQWATEQLPKVRDSNDDEDKNTADKLRKIAAMHGNWVFQRNDVTGAYLFQPVSVAGFSTRLFSGVGRTLAMSATMTEHSLNVTVHPEDHSYDYRAWGQVFNPAHAPVYYWPTKRLSWKSTDEDYREIIARMDEIIDARQDRKGIVHTVSYGRGQKIYEYSRHTRSFLTNENAKSLPDTLKRFRESSPGTVLVTPSIAAGFDFPGTDAEYQIILKFPFPNERQLVIKERCTRIAGYRLASAAQEFVQMCGRARRYEEDRSETFCLDNSVAQLTGPHARQYLPPGFRIFTITKMPPAPPRVKE